MRTTAGVALLMLAACPPAKPADCPRPEPQPVVAAPPVAPKHPELDDQGVISQSRAFFDAHDRADAPAIKAFLGPAFVKFGHSRFYDAKDYTQQVATRMERKAPPLSRTCADEQVFRQPAAAVYVGVCTVKIPAHDEMPATTSEGWETLVWVVDGETWKVSHWQWQRAGLDAEREDWNDVYRSSVSFNTSPNQFLVETVRGRRVGVALDIAMGQGRNAIYLAQQRWRVTGVDISDEGIKIARESAALHKVKLDVVQQDIDKYDFGTNKWDLVTLIYAGDDAKTIDRIKPSIRRGGLFVVEFFHEDATKGTGIGGFATGELAKQFAGWKIVKDVVVDDVADWGLSKTKLVRFAAEKP